MSSEHAPEAMTTSRLSVACRALAVTGLLSVHAALLAYSGARHSPTIDEIGHLPAGVSYWHYGRFGLYSVNPPLVKLAGSAPVVLARPRTEWRSYNPYPGARAEFAIGRDFLEANSRRAIWYFTLARWGCIPFSLLGGYVCYRWARELHGDAAGFTALVLWCFSPNILGNAALITMDAPAAAMGVLAAYLFWRWLNEPRAATALWAGIGLGLAELTKFTWAVLLLIYPTVWAITAWRSRTKQTSSRVSMPRTARRATPLQMASILLLGVFVINLGYGFEGSFRRLGDFEFFSATLAGETRDRSHPDNARNKFRGSLVGELPVPLPKHYVLGVDLQKHDFETGKPSYLRGEWRTGGRWYWYLYALAVKVPLGTWMLFVVALATYIARRRSRSLCLSRDELLLLLTPLAVLLLVSSQTGFSRYLRYALPVLPFWFIWISAAFNDSRGRAASGRTVSGESNVTGQVRKLCAFSALIWSVASSLWVYPHNLSYFNEFAGGPANGHQHLLDANVDWGQDLLFLRDWADEHRANRPLYVDCFANYSLEHVGVPFSPPPTKFPPGWYAISVHRLHSADGRYRRFLNTLPTARIGYSIHVYRVE